MVNTFRSSYPVRLALAATLLISIVLPVAQVACSLDGKVSMRAGQNVVIGERTIAGFSSCDHLRGVLASSHQQVDRCQREAETRGMDDCEFRPYEVVEVVPVPPTEESPRLLAVSVSFLLELAPTDLSEPLAAGAFPRAAVHPAPQHLVSLQVLFSSFLI